MNKLSTEKDANDLSAEITGISMIVTGLANQAVGDCDQLNQKSLQSALYGVAQYLERIAIDIGEMDV